MWLILQLGLLACFALTGICLILHARRPDPVRLRRVGSWLRSLLFFNAIMLVLWLGSLARS